MLSRSHTLQKGVSQLRESTSCRNDAATVATPADSNNPISHTSTPSTTKPRGAALEVTKTLSTPPTNTLWRPKSHEVELGDVAPRDVTLPCDLATATEPLPSAHVQNIGQCSEEWGSSKLMSITMAEVAVHITTLMNEIFEAELSRFNRLE